MLVKNIWLKNIYENEIESKNFENNFEKFVYTDSNSLEFIFIVNRFQTSKIILLIN